VEPESQAGYGTPNTFTVHGTASNGTGQVQLVWDDFTLQTGLQTSTLQANVNSNGTWDNTIYSDHYCHSIGAYANYDTVSSPKVTTTLLYNGSQNAPYCLLNPTWIEPGASFNLPTSLVVEGTVAGAPSGTLVTLWWLDATAGGSTYINGGTYAPGSNGVWYGAISDVNFGHTYYMYITYDGVNSLICKYIGNNKQNWCTYAQGL
jgi:hypothetical protein